jgi:membrane protein
MLEKIKNAYRYMTEGIWLKDESEYETRFMRWFSEQLKVFMFTISSFGRNQLIVRSAGLTYYTLMAIVPLAAVVFGVAKGFGFEGRIIEGLYETLPRYRSIIDQVTAFAHNMIAQTRGGLIATVGFLILFWSVIQVFMNVEDSFNYIWEVRRQRNIARKISDYIAILILAPIVLVFFSWAGDQVQATLDGLVRGTFLMPLLEFLRGFIPFVSAWLVFTLVYVVMPNTKVHFTAALKAGVLAGTLFVAMQLFYAYSQGALSRYNAVYGTFAALPLFLIWLNLCWMIIMFGAELTFGYQNIRNYQYERQSVDVSQDYRRKILLLVMHRIAYAFTKGEKEMDSDQMAGELNVPVRIIRDALFDLEQAGLILSVEDDTKTKTVRYFPARDVSGLRVYDVISAVDARGLSTLHMKELDELRSINRVMGRMDRLVRDSKDNVLMSDIPMIYEEPSDHDRG